MTLATHGWSQSSSEPSTMASPSVAISTGRTLLIFPRRKKPLSGSIAFSTSATRARRDRRSSWCAARRTPWRPSSGCWESMRPRG